LEQVERKKPGPAPKPKLDTEQLLARIDALEKVLIEVATHTGYSAILRKHGLEAYQPTKKDMSRFA
jgi:hypothetical protein